MIPLPPFEVERWMNEYEVRPNILNLAETCVASVSLTELANLAGLNDARSIVDVNTILDYGTIRGSESLRENVVELHGGPSIVGIDNVLITQGAIAANFQVLCTLIDPGDHVICVSPTYQQLYSFPKALGAEVTLWKLKADLGYMPDVTELEQLVTPKTSVTLFFVIRSSYSTYSDII